MTFYIDCGRGDEWQIPFLYSYNELALLVCFIHISFPQATNMASWIIKIALMAMSILIETTEGKKDKVLYCSGKLGCLFVHFILFYLLDMGFSGCTCNAILIYSQCRLQICIVNKYCHKISTFVKVDSRNECLVSSFHII